MKEWILDNGKNFDCKTNLDHLWFRYFGCINTYLSDLDNYRDFKDFNDLSSMLKHYEEQMKPRGALEGFEKNCQIIRKTYDVLPIANKQKTKELEKFIKSSILSLEARLNKHKGNKEEKFLHNLVINAPYEILIGAMEHSTHYSHCNCKQALFTHKGLKRIELGQIVIRCPKCNKVVEIKVV